MQRKNSSLGIIKSAEFEAAVILWAKQQFTREIESGFARAQAFNSFASQSFLRVLRNRSDGELRTLARILPAYSMAADRSDEERAASLSDDERLVLSRYKADLQRDHLESFNQQVLLLNRKRDPKIKAEFKSSVAHGKLVIKELAERLGARAASAAPGEWGLIFLKNNLRLTVAVRLARQMELCYDLSIAEQFSMRTYCFHRHYLGVLGIGSSSWALDSSKDVGEKIIAAVEFGMWHKEQYEGLLTGGN